MRSCVAFIAAIATIWLAVSSVRAAEVDTFSVAGWEGRAFTDDDTGEFSHCAILADYHNGLTLIFAYGTDAVWWMSVVNPGWDLKPHTQHYIYYRVDELSFVEDEGFVVDKDQINVDLGRSDPLIDQLRGGGSLTVEVDRKSWTFDMGGTGVAFDETLACTKHHFSVGTRSQPSSRLGSDAAERDAGGRMSGTAGSETAPVAGERSAAS